MPDRAWFWDRIARRYARTPVPDADVYERKLASTRARLTPVSRVLELGCGTGTTAVKHAPHCARIDAVDVSPAMIEIARGRARGAGVENISFNVGTVEDFTAPPESYDMVMMHSLLHLLDDPRTAIEKAARLLKPGGWLVSSTTATGDDGLALIALLMRPAAALGFLPRLNGLTADTLRRMMTDTGFEIVEDWKPRPRQAVFIVARKI
ncbi:MAG: methyltransferase domain-containing protein [Paracoccaceae bacterium]|nr:methyltransferase domain-containing protein [Paracoccaceae bacterium]